MTASPASSTIVSVSKEKEVSLANKPKTPLKLLLKGKEMEEDINLNEEIVIPQINFDTATIEELRLLS